MISLILMAGGRGTRMQQHCPKQFLSLHGTCITQYSLDVFQEIPEISEIIMVCPPTYRSLFAHTNLIFAEPGERRQDSMINGLACVSSTAQWICTHDAARPFVSRELLYPLFEAGKKTGAATLATPVKATIKEVEQGIVRQTLNREQLWEIQTPQLIQRTLLEEGIKRAQALDVTVTDDVSFVELLGHPVQIVPGSYRNIKITTQEDLYTANAYAQI